MRWDCTRGEGEGANGCVDDKMCEKLSRKSEDNGSWRIWLTDRWWTHCIAIIYSASPPPPPLLEPPALLTPTPMNACNVTFAPPSNSVNPTPNKGKCPGNFREWSSSFRDIRQGLNSQAALFTGIAIENSVKRVFRTLSNIETTIDCLMDLKMRWNKGFSLRMTQIVSWILGGTN